MCLWKLLELYDITFIMGEVKIIWETLNLSIKYMNGRSFDEAVNDLENFER